MEQLPIAIKKHRLVVLKDFFLGREGFYRRREIERKKRSFSKGTFNTTKKMGNSRYVCYRFLFAFMIFVLHLLFLLLVYHLFVGLRITMATSLSIVDHRFECMFYFC